MSTTPNRRGTVNRLSRELAEAHALAEARDRSLALLLSACGAIAELRGDNASTLTRMLELVADSARLDELEQMARKPGGVLLHNGTERGRCGIGLTPGRTLRSALDSIGGR